MCCKYTCVISLLKQQKSSRAIASPSNINIQYFQTETPLIPIEHLYGLHTLRFKRVYNVWIGHTLTECLLYNFFKILTQTMLVCYIVCTQQRRSTKQIAPSEVILAFNFRVVTQYAWPVFYLGQPLCDDRDLAFKSNLVGLFYFYVHSLYKKIVLYIYFLLLCS